MKRKKLGSAFWQNGFFADFNFEPPDLFADFVAGFFSSFCGKKCPQKSSRNIPDKILQIYTTDVPDNFLQRGQAQE